MIRVIPLVIGSVFGAGSIQIGHPKENTQIKVRYTHVKLPPFYEKLKAKGLAR